jgi:hypothetical protein
MIKLKGTGIALRWLLSATTVAILAVGIAPLMLAQSARAEDGEQGKAWKDITMIYSTDIKGKIEPCG